MAETKARRVWLAIALFATGCGGVEPAPEAVGERQSGIAAVASPDMLGPERLIIEMVPVDPDGDGIIVKFPNQSVMLIDGGKHENGDFARQLHLEGLDQPNKISYVMLSHPHDDHFGGLTAAMQWVKPCTQCVLDPGYDPTSPSDGYARWLAAIAGKRAANGTPGVGPIHGPPVLLSSYLNKNFGGPTVLPLDGEVLWAENARGAGGARNDNDTSIIMRLDYGSFSMLFQGDATGNTAGPSSEEMKLRAWAKATGFSLNATVLKVGHHGSKTSTNALYLADVQPQLALISSTANNRYGHPDCEVLATLKAQAGLHWYRTDKNGLISIITDGNAYHVWSQNPSTRDVGAPECSYKRTPAIGAGK